MNFVNALVYGGQVAITGILIVFFGLALLIGCVAAMAKIFDVINAKKKAREEAAAAEAARQAAANAPAVVETPVEEEVVDDAELIAVIAAAIAAFDNSGKSLVVRKVRRVTGWDRAARTEQVTRF